MNQKNRQLPSLQQFAFKSVCRYHINLKKVLDLIRYFEQIDWLIEEGPRMKEKCIYFVIRAYEGLRAEHGMEHLSEYVQQELMKDLEKERAITKKELEKIRILGSVQERRPLKPPAAKRNISMGIGSLQRSVSGAAVPVSQRRGTDWPEDIDPRKREEYLDPHEFISVFGMPYDIYRGILPWKRNQIKKDKDLF